jgi:hypothetical protein
MARRTAPQRGRPGTRARPGSTSCSTASCPRCSCGADRPRHLPTYKHAHLSCTRTKPSPDRPRKNSLPFAALVATALRVPGVNGAGGSRDAAHRVARSHARAYGVQRVFAKHWLETGQEVTINQSHAGSGAQAAVTPGGGRRHAGAGVRHRCPEREGRAHPRTGRRAPPQRCPYTSTIVFRPQGQPEGHHD